jgi:cellulose synthase/poly-beta-1,6-N-acetylglucosamine synthase-like glycosyltransferase
MANFENIYRILETFFLLYFLVYNSLNLFFLFVSFGDIRRRTICKGFEDLDVALASPLTPPLSIIVPAFNEETIIADSVRTFLNLEFPMLEIIVVNDGSTDATLEVLKKTFDMRRIDIDYLDRIGTQPAKGFYEAKGKLPEHISRFIVIDKDNGGRADSVNAGINASRCPYFLSIDADSILDETALLQTFRAVLQNPDIVGIGGQIAIINGCKLKNNRVVERRMPKSSLARFQVVEYIRSFAVGRIAFAKYNGLILISGAFGIFQKEFIQKIGGYLTQFLASKIVLEFGGVKQGTVCEDIELTVRLQRYIREKKLRKKVAFAPHPLCWTEVPETLSSLSKQRNRWQRGLIETLRYHRKMLFNKTYGIVGLFSFPYYFFFELLGAPIEFLGYVCLPLLFLLDNFNYTYCILFFAFSVLYGIFLSVGAVIVSVWPARTSETDMSGSTLLYFKDSRDLAILLLYAVLENFGYRQLTVWWRIRGTIDYFRGKRGWDKFARKGFDTQDGGAYVKAVT